MASKIVPVVGDDWTELSAAPSGCFENQTNSTLLYWASALKPEATQTKGHQLSMQSDKGFQLDDSIGIKLWGRTLSNGGEVIVTEY